MDDRQVADNLKAFRKARKMSQVQLAERSGVSQAHISNIEKGNKENPGIHTMKSLADALGITVDDILKPHAVKLIPCPVGGFHDYQPEWIWDSKKDDYDFNEIRCKKCDRVEGEKE